MAKLSLKNRISYKKCGLKKFPENACNFSQDGLYFLMSKSVNVSCSRFGGTRNGVRVPTRSSLCDAPPPRAEISQLWQLIGISVKAQDARSSENSCPCIGKIGSCVPRLGAGRFLFAPENKICPHRVTRYDCRETGRRGRLGNPVRVRSIHPVAVIAEVCCSWREPVIGKPLRRRNSKQWRPHPPGPQEPEYRRCSYACGTFLQWNG